MEVDATLGLVSLSTNIYCDKMEKISDLKIFLNVSAGHWKRCGRPHWPAGRYLPTPANKSIKNYKSLPECPTITALVAAFDAKAFSDMELLKSCLDGGNRIIKFLHANQPKTSSLNILQKMAYVFYKFHICFVLSVLKKNKHIPHIFGCAKLLKHNVRTTLRLQWRF